MFFCNSYLQGREEKELRLAVPAGQESGLIRRQLVDTPGVRDHPALKTHSYALAVFLRVDLLLKLYRRCVLNDFIGLWSETVAPQTMHQNMTRPWCADSGALTAENLALRQAAREHSTSTHDRAVARYEHRRARQQANLP